MLIDQTEMEIDSLEPEVDRRQITAKVAGPGSLLVAKLFKISERKGTVRSNDKDALDILRILQGIETDVLANRIGAVLGNERSKAAGERALVLLDRLFGNRAGEGSMMAARATQPLMDDDEVRLMCECS